MYIKLLREKNQMHVKFEDSVWIAQSATCGNTQNTAVDLAASYTEAVLAIMQSKEFELQNFALSCSRKEWGVLSVVAKHHKASLAPLFLHL
jgi:hypothetical protein